MRVYVLTTHLVKIIPKVKEMSLAAVDTWLTIRKVVVKYSLKTQEMYPKCTKKNRCKRE